VVKSNENSKSATGQVTWARYVSVLTGILALIESLIKLSENYPALRSALSHTSITVVAGLGGAILSYFASRRSK
jgi:hypothetical protein